MSDSARMMGGEAEQMQNVGAIHYLLEMALALPEAQTESSAGRIESSVRKQVTGCGSGRSAGK